MSTITLFHEYASPELLRQLLDYFGDQGAKTLILYSVFKEGLDPKVLKEVVQTQQAFSKGRKVVFKNHAVVFGACKLSLAAKKFLAANSFSVEFALGSDYEQKLQKVAKPLRELNLGGVSSRIWVDVSENQYEVYKACNLQGLGVHFYEPQFTAREIARFDAWLSDPSATAVNTFTDIIYSLTLQLRSHNCRHGSCLGNTFYADRDGQLYMCPICRNESTFLGKPEGKGLQELFGAAGVYNTICNAVSKRTGCVDTCRDFAYCQGGCPLQAECCYKDGHYTALLHHIHTKLREIYNSGSLDGVNNVVKNAILNAVAFRTAFLNDGRKENTHGQNPRI